jgi:S1-C subfamily serine protease
MILLLDLRADGNAGFDTLYSSVAVLQEIFDRARFDPQTVRLNRTLILQTIDLSRALGSASVAEDLQRRLAEFDASQSSSGARPADRDQPSTAAVQSVSGTGFMASSDGAILTALHVVEGGSEIEAIDGDGNIHRARLIGKLPDLDVALLEVDLKNAPALVVPASLRAVSGDAVFTIGFPATELLGTEPKFSDGAISALSGLKGDLSRMQVSVPIQPGNSGGPLVNERGEAIGVVVSSAAAASFYRNTGALPQNVNFAVRTDLAKSLLAGRAKSTLPPCESLQEAIERTRRALYRIQAR